MQIDSYEWFIGREKNKPCLVAGTAPTIVNFPYSKFKGVYITCGDGPLRLKNLFKPDYWVNANHIFPVPEQHIDIINSFTNTVFIFADSVTYSYRTINPHFLKNNIKVRWFAYDQRHFNGKPCPNKKLKCCKLLNIYPGRITLQEFIQKKYNRPTHYSSGSTVAIHALAFAILMGCSPIYLQGIEIPKYANDYIHKPAPEIERLIQPKYIDRIIEKLKQPDTWLQTGYRTIRRIAKRIFQDNYIIRQSAFFDDIPQILSDFEYLINLANEHNIDIYNLSTTSTLNEIKTLKKLDWFSVNGK